MTNVFDLVFMDNEGELSVTGTNRLAVELVVTKIKNATVRSVSLAKKTLNAGEVVHGLDDARIWEVLPWTRIVSKKRRLWKQFFFSTGGLSRTILVKPVAFEVDPVIVLVLDRDVNVLNRLRAVPELDAILHEVAKNCDQSLTRFAWACSLRWWSSQGLRRRRRLLRLGWRRSLSRWRRSLLPG